MTDITDSSAQSMAVSWFKSSYSGGEGNECVEIADIEAGVGVRDSKVPQEGNLTVSRDAFTAFLQGLVDEDRQPLC